MNNKAPSDTAPINRPSFYVGIGASAGGLEALQQFFGRTPENTGACFIVVQHLSPDFKSMMPELLEKCTRMPIFKVTDGVTLEANTIYLMPARKNMLTAEGKLFLSDIMPNEQLHLPIDVFFHSLAQDLRQKAVAVILSGTGSDGTRGIKAVKECDGLVLVQNPESAQFDGMPSSASRTGLADMILSPEKMGKALANYFNHPLVQQDEIGLPPPLTQGDDENDVLRDIFELLKKECAINFSDYKSSTVARRIGRRLGINQLESLIDYRRLLRDSTLEKQILSKELLIGVTRFFRDTHAFEKIANTVIPNVVANCKAKKEIRIWIAGCSTGEEAYSLAILADEYVQSQKLDYSIKVFATDVDEEAIAIASQGSFLAEELVEIEPERIERYFERFGENLRIISRIRKMIIFATHNMIEDPPFSNIDLVSCRNVLIYFQHSAQKRVLSNLFFSLNPDGYLFLGNSETIGELSAHTASIDERARIYQKSSNVKVPLSAAPPRRAMLDRGPLYRDYSAAPAHYDSKSSGKKSFTLKAVMERLIDKYSPPSIVLNSSLEALHIFGDVSKYTRGIKPGRISHYITDFLKEELHIAVTTALRRAEQKKEDVYYEGVVVPTSSGQIQSDLIVLFVQESLGNQASWYYIVQFRHSEEEATNANPIKITFDAQEQSRQRIDDLEQELLRNKEHLQVTVEELETTNEELQSANEELMSANEELQSTNEELQSVNEELYTVNSEYQEKITELTELANDLDSVMNATDMGIVFLDDQLTVRKFTPKTNEYIHLRSTDIGRPFHHISHELQHDHLMNDIAKVASGKGPIEREISARDGRAVWLRVLPYREHRNGQCEGVLITITNVSRLRFIESALKQAQDELRESLLNRNLPLKRKVMGENKYNILILDDDEVDLQSISRLLDKIPDKDLRLFNCATIDQAIEVVDGNIVNLCFVDYRLAKETAKDFCDRLHAINQDIPIIILSGLDDSEFDENFLSNEVFDFLNKDELSSQLLARSIDYVMERSNIKKAIEKLES